MRALAALLLSLSPGYQFTLEVDVPVVSIDVSVTTSDGGPVSGLVREDFRLFDEGVEQEIRYFAPARAPYHLYLLLDVSNSTADQRGMMSAVSSALLDSLDPGDRLALGAFSEEAETLVGWSESPAEAADRLGEWLERRGRDGTTRFYRAVTRVVENDMDEVAERRALLVLTDGRDQSLYQVVQQEGRLPGPDEDSSFIGAERAVEEAGVPVYFVALNTDVNLEAGAEGNEYRSLEILYPGSGTAMRYLGEVRTRLERLAEVSGGRVAFPDGAGDAVPLLRAISGELGNAYSLGWERPREAGSGPRRIEVRIPGRDYRIGLSRRTYQP